MALSGLEIYKLLPRTNCKKCGFQTCLAFAMQLTKKAVALEKCPFVTADVRAVLEEATQPSMRLVEIGSVDNKVSIGNETVMFRHEEKFYHPTAFGCILEDDISQADLKLSLDEIVKLEFERVGQKLKVDLIALKEISGKKEKFVAVLCAIKRLTGFGLVLMPASLGTLKAAIDVCGDRKPLVYCAHIGLLDGFVQICKENKLALAFRGSSVAEFSSCAKKIISSGLSDLVFDIADNTVSERLWQLTQIRRLALKKNDRSLGFPTMVIVGDQDEYSATTQAATYCAKYASIVLLKSRKPEHILPLLTLRQNIFTDPQKPLQVEPNVYTVGAANEGSPVLITTNFSLTYYTVLGEIEASRIPSYLICVDTQGMSVLTAWAAEKFTSEHIADTLIRYKLSDIVKHKNLIIPGYVAMMSGDLEEKSGWKILVGPREAAGISSYLKNLSV